MSVHRISLHRPDGPGKDTLLDAIDATDATRRLVIVARLAALQFSSSDVAAAAFETCLDVVEHSLEDIYQRLQEVLDRERLA